MRIISPIAAAVAAFAALAGVSNSRAADIITPVAYPDVAPADQATPTEWSFKATPYFWMAGLSGDVAVFGAPPVTVDVSFSDALGGLNFSFMGAAEARYGPYSLTTDLFAIKTTLSAKPRPNRLLSKVDLSSTTVEATVLAGYALVDSERVTLDLVAGPRVWHVRDKLRFIGGRLNGLSVTDEATWIDAMGGVKAKVDLTPNLYLTGIGLAGAGMSNFGWDATAAVGYEISDRFSALAGYRAMGVDYKSGSFEFDTTFQGPILGLEIRF